MNALHGALTLARVPTALAPAILEDGEDPVFVDSAARRILTRDIRAYGQRRVDGRAFLVSGHRGSGKTHLVLRAVESAILMGQGQHDCGRPLLVRLNGARLIESADEAARAAAEGSTEDAAVAKRDAASREHLLQMVTVSLYRELCALFSGAVQRRVRTLHEQQALPRPQLTSLGELSAQLQVDLEGMPELRRLRECWYRLGALDHGVLFSDNAPPGQGASEVAALWSFGRAYLTINGQFEERRSTGTSATDDAEVSSSRAAIMEELTRLIAPVLSGALVGVPLWEPVGALGSVMLALATALGVSAMDSTRRVSSGTSSNADVSWVADATPDALARRLPRLLEQLRQCGLAPIFLVDELDKVDDVVERLPELLGHLKDFISEQAFFIFVTHRDQYERLTHQVQGESYGRLHTLFTHRVHVSYTPAALRAYVADRLQLTGNDPHLGHVAAIAPWVLVHRAQGHVFDLRQQLSQATDHHDRLRPEVLSPDDPRTQDELLLQAALEQALDDSLLRRWMDDPADPINQAVLDAAWFLSRAQANAEAVVVISPAAVADYLCDRMCDGLLPEDPADRPVVPPDLQRAAHDLVCRAADLLVQPADIDWTVHANPRPLLQRAADTDGHPTYHWLRDRHGRALHAPTPRTLP